MINSFVFSGGRVAEQSLSKESLLSAKKNRRSILWIDLESPTEEEAKFVLEEMFGFHPLAVEDCLTETQLPKIEDFENYLFIVMHAVDFSRKDKFSTSELNLFVGRNFLATYHRTPLKFVQVIQDRFAKHAMPPVQGSDRLAHTLLDGMVEHYIPVMEELTDQVEELEDFILDASQSITIENILSTRKDLSHLRQILRPQREIVSKLASGENRFIRAKLLPYFRNLCDSITRVEETARSYAERLLLDFDIYTNRVANETNQGIKFLTALTAITLPPIIIGGWYGMNFRHMPELAHPWGYGIASAATIVAIVVMWLWLKSKKWF